MMLLEVERKFRRLAVKQLLPHLGSPPFQTLQHYSKQTFQDIYYDASGLPASRGIWIRQRDGRWQAKIRIGGNYNNSKFEELSGPTEISAYLKGVTGQDYHERDNFGLTQMASFHTFRERWIADREFTIVQDVTDFNHTVGEVELETRLERDINPNQDITQYKNAIMMEMDEKIITFMKRYSWAFCAGEPKGKLTAYFERFPRLPSDGSK